MMGAPLTKIGMTTALILAISVLPSAAGNFLDKAKQAQKKQYQENDATYQANRNAAAERRSQWRSLRIKSGPDWTPRGRCKGFERLGEYPLRYSDGSHGTLFLQCSDNCWNVSLGGPFGVVAPAVACGDFNTPWSANGKWSQPNSSMIDIGNFVLAEGY